MSLTFKTHVNHRVAGSGMKLMKECPCGWYRYVTDDEKQQVREYIHAEYGRVTYIQAARYDVRNHNCQEYLISVNRIREHCMFLQRRGLAQY